MVETLGVLNGTAKNNLAETMKNLNKLRMRRQVYENPEFARQLVKIEATATYNARGDVVQAVSGDLGNA
ncbi:hypothetical protein [Salidesulfovibrio onnuriiensis]|uniref:hypothetical protein n=1 Tax=Salidesulfovibrio onnuriiensis TaxID=2583823 RepID=UPI0011C942C7|nr:hypothetical protein [Salidesulfovibrio onnuriiensis]